MGTTTKNLGLYKPAANDYYNVEKDQNENFDKIDAKFGEVDKTKLDKGSYEGDADDLKREIDGKEPAFSKKSGFNKEKTSEYKTGKDAEKIFTQEGANNLYKKVQEDIKNIDLSGKTDKGGYNGTAQDLKDEVDDKQSKTDNTLETTNKTIIGAINEVLYNRNAKYIGDTSSTTNIDSIQELGLRISQNIKNRWEGLPFAMKQDSSGGSFTLEITQSYDNTSNGYFTQRIKPRNTNREYMRGYSGGYTDWVEVINTGSPIYKGLVGMGNFKYIQEIGEKQSDEIYIDLYTGKPYKCLRNNSDTSVTDNYISIDNKTLSENVIETGTQVIAGETWYWKLHKKTKILEQWALIASTTGTITKTLPKSYVDKNYIIVVSSGNMNSDTTVSAQGETGNTFSVRNSINNKNKTYVYTIGIIRE